MTSANADTTTEITILSPSYSTGSVRTKTLADIATIRILNLEFPSSTSPKILERLRTSIVSTQTNNIHVIPIPNENIEAASYFSPTLTEELNSVANSKAL